MRGQQFVPDFLPHSNSAPSKVISCPAPSAVAPAAFWQHHSFSLALEPSGFCTHASAAIAVFIDLCREPHPRAFSLQYSACSGTLVDSEKLARRARPGLPRPELMWRMGRDSSMGQRGPGRRARNTCHLQVCRPVTNTAPMVMLSAYSNRAASRTPGAD